MNHIGANKARWLPFTCKEVLKWLYLIEELIAQKETIEKKRKEEYDLETSVGTITMKKPTKAFVAEVLDLTEDNDEYMVYNLCTSPNLKDDKLQKAYGCSEPLDIVKKLFEPGEVTAIAKAVMAKAGYGESVEAKVHEEVKKLIKEDWEAATAAIWSSKGTRWHISFRYLEQKNCFAYAPWKKKRKRNRNKQSLLQKGRCLAHGGLQIKCNT